MKKILGMATLLAALGCFSLPAFAGVVISTEMSNTNGQQKQKSTTYIDSGRIRMEIEGMTHIVMIFDSNKQVLWVLAPDKGTYSEMTAGATPGGSMADRRQQAMADAQKRMQDQMASLPPDQRAKMEQMMKGMNPPASAITYESTGATEKVGAFTCSKYNALTNGKRSAEHCTVPFDQLHLSAADVKTFVDFGKFMKTRMGTRATSTPAIEEMKGYPVHTVIYSGDKPAYESTVVNVEHKSVDSSLFAVPAGLKKEDRPGMGSRGGAPPH